MAGDWIKMRGNLWDDPRIASLCDATEQSEAAVIGALYWLWATADQHSQDGVMPGLTLRRIDQKTGVAGIGEALVKAGWLSVQDDGVCITRFEEHNGASAKKRSLTAKRVAKHTSANAKTESNKETANAPSVSSALAREEKRREDISVAKATAAVGGDKLPADYTKDELWKAGKSLLHEQGMPIAQCGSFVGKLTKDYGGEIVAEAVRVAVVERPADAASYLKAVCQRAAGERKPMQSFRERDAQLASDRVALVAPSIAANKTAPYVDAADFAMSLAKSKPLEIEHG